MTDARDKMHISDRMKLFLRAGVAIVLLAYLLLTIDVHAIVSTVAGMSIMPIIACLPLICLMYVIRTEKWRILLRAVDVRIDFIRAFKVFLIGTFYGSVTPGRAGELTRSLYLEDSKARTLPTVIVDRVTDIVCLLALCILMILAVFHEQELVVITLVTVGGFLALCAVMLDRRSISLFTKLMGIGDGHRDEYLASVSSMLHNGRALLSTLGLTLAYYVVNTVVFWLVLMSISPSINPVIALSLPLIIIMGNVPISISGLGVRELVSVTVFSAFGDSAAYGFSASLILYLLTSLLPGLVGSLFTLGGVRPYEAEKREL